jgi:hypothetical protein
MLKHCAANRKRRLSVLPNVGPYIYDVKISGKFLGTWQSVYAQLWHRKTLCIGSILKHFAANRKRWFSALPNVDPDIYDVKISGFTRSSIYLQNLGWIRMESFWCLVVWILLVFVSICVRKSHKYSVVWSYEVVTVLFISYCLLRSRCSSRARNCV